MLGWLRADLPAMANNYLIMCLSFISAWHLLCGAIMGDTRVTRVTWTLSSSRDISSTDFMFNLMAFKKWRWWIPDCCGCNLRHFWQISGNLGWDCESWPISWFCPIWDFLSHISTMDWLEANYTHSKHTRSNFDGEIALLNDSPSAFPSFQHFIKRGTYTVSEDNWLSCNLV